MADDTSSKEQTLRNLLQQCHGFDGDTLSTDREAAFDYYFQRKRGDEVDGRSDVVSGDLSAMVEATVAQMTEAFSSSRIVDFDPLSADDEDQAALESEAVHYYVMGRENGFLQILSAIKELLLARNGVIEIDAEEVTRHRTKRYGNVEPDAIGELLAPFTVIDQTYDESAKELQFTYETTSREFRMESVPMQNFVFYAEWHKPELEGIPVCAVRHVTTRSVLTSIGVPADKVNALAAHKVPLRAEEFARNPRNAQKNSLSYDKSQELVEWFKVFVRQESTNGADELRCIRYSYQDGVILSDEPAPFINLAAGTAIINPHRFVGISLYDKLKQNQDMRTQLKRALLDNVNATTKNRLAGLDGVVNEDDATSGRVNNLIRVKNLVPDVRAALMPLAVPDTSANILANLEHTAKERSEMGGAALDMQSAQMQIGGDRMGSQGLEKAYSVSEQLTAAMMKTLSATLIRSVFLVAHKVLREYFDEELPIRRDGKWTYVRPWEWPERTSLTIKPGMSPGERQRKVNAMSEVLNAQMMMSDRGMDQVLVDVHGFNRALMDWARLSEVQNPEQYFIDPDSRQSQLAMQNKQEAAKRDEMNRAALMQQSFGMEQLRTALEKYRHDTELQFKYFAELLGVEVDEAKIAGDAAIQLLKGQGNATRTNGASSDGETATTEQAVTGDTQSPQS